jgi:hypothetical protein
MIHLNVRRSSTLAASSLILALATQSLAQSPTPPAGAPAQQASAPSPSNGVTGASATATPGAQPAGGSAVAPSKPVVAGGKPPTVIGPSGKPVSEAKAPPRAITSGSRAAFSLSKPQSRGLRVGLSTTNGEAASNQATAVVSLPINAAPQAVVQIPLPASTGAAGANTHAVAIPEANEGASVHTWTRQSSTFATGMIPAQAQLLHGEMGKKQMAGSSLTTANANANPQKVGSVPFGVVNGMINRIGGMSSVLKGRTNTAAVDSQ